MAMAVFSTAVTVADNSDCVAVARSAPPSVNALKAWFCELGTHCTGVHQGIGMVSDQPLITAKGFQKKAQVFTIIKGEW